jgi:thiaminase
MAPCLIGYGVIARRLYDDPLTKREGNIYWKWIENYVADDFAEAVRVGSGKLFASVPSKAILICDRYY